MSNDPILKREPLLEFIADRQFLSSAEITQELTRMGIAGQLSEPGSRHYLGRWLSRVLPSLPEGPYLGSLLTHTEFLPVENYVGHRTRPSDTLHAAEAYMPAPGSADAIALAPQFDSDEYADLPSHARRSAAWLIVKPNPALVVLTFDPSALPELETAKTFWLTTAQRCRPDVAASITDPARHFVGLTSPHQMLHPGERWRRMPVAEPLRNAAEEFRLDPFFETELALYCWTDANDTIPPRTLQGLSDIIQRRVVVRPRIYPTHIAEQITPPAPPPVRLLNLAQDRWRQLFMQLVEDCAEEGDSDIHLLPNESGGYCIQRRRSGHLRYIGSIPSSAGAAYLAASLAGSQIELANRPSHPKDGRVTIHLPRLRRTIDLRIAVAPGAPPYNNPAVVFRLLDPSSVRGGLEQILFSQADRQAWEFAMQADNGLILVTGPTGSGKSRTLYAYLQSLHKRFPNQSFKSIEDPIELRLGGWFQQNQVHHEAGADFAMFLRAMMRADPETILIGEIRDEETARQAITAGRSGHRIISSLHTKTPADVPGRLRDLGVKPCDIKDLLRFVSSQELLGRSCPHCRSFVSIPEEAKPILRENFDASAKVAVNAGCPQCFNLGVRGRFASQEYLIISADDHELVEAIGTADPALISKMQRERQQPSLAERSLSFAIGENALTNLKEALPNIAGASPGALHEKNTAAAA